MDFHRRLLFCRSLRACRGLHGLLLVSGQSADILLSTDLLNLYSRLGDLPSAALSFNQSPMHNIFSFNSMISSFTRHGFFGDAIICFHRLLASPDLRPDSFTFPVTLKSCTALHDVQKMHSFIQRMGLEADKFVLASLISAYSKFGSVDHARKVFNEMRQHVDAGCWNAIISGLCQNGRESDAVQVFGRMVKEDSCVDKVTIASILPASASLNDLILAN